MSATYKFASEIYTEYMNTSIKFDRISLFTEASRTEYDINRKEALLRTLKESATDEEYYSFLKEAEEIGLRTRLRNLSTLLSSLLISVKSVLLSSLRILRQASSFRRLRMHLASILKLRVRQLSIPKQMVLLRHLIMVFLSLILRQQRLVLLELPMVMMMKLEIFLKRPCRKLAVR